MSKRKTVKLKLYKIVKLSVTIRVATDFFNFFYISTDVISGLWITSFLVPFQYVIKLEIRKEFLTVKNYWRHCSIATLNAFQLIATNINFKLKIFKFIVIKLFKSYLLVIPIWNLILIILSKYFIINNELNFLNISRNISWKFKVFF